MKRWVIGGVVLGFAAVWGYLALTKKNPPAAVLPEPVVEVTPAAAEPVAAAPVVDVTDIDPLLDPPAVLVLDPPPEAPLLIAVGADEPTRTTTAPAEAPPAIPPAAEDGPATIPFIATPDGVGIRFEF